MSESTVEVQNRELLGKNAARRLRRRGEVPAVVYGDGKDPVSVSIHRKTMTELVAKVGENAVFLLKMAGTDNSRHVMIRDLQINALNGQMVHVDFQRIRMDQKVHVAIPIELHGIAIGVKNEEGLLDFVTREIEVECLPGKIPAHLELDVSELHVGQHVEAGQIELPEGVALRDEADRVIVSVGQSKLAETTEEETEDDLLEGAREEPEVMARGKDDE